MPNTINLRLLENKNIIAELNGIPLAQENSYKIIAGEENATQFKIISKPAKYENARYTVEMVNSQGFGINETDIIEDTFALPVGMAVAGYGIIQIRAYQGEEVVPFMPLKVKVWNTLPNWKDHISDTSIITQTTGYSSSLVMSQGAVTRELEDIREELREATIVDVRTIAQRIDKNTNKIKAVENALIKEGTIAKENSIMSSVTQQTGGAGLLGLNVLDNSYATIKKIQGSTDKSKNLFNPLAKTYSGVAAETKNADGSITVTANRIYESLNYPINAKPGDTISISGRWIVSGENNGGLRVMYFEGNAGKGSIICSVFTSNRSASGVVTEPPTENAQLCLALYGNTDGDASGGASATYSNIMVNIGSPLPYQPYFDGLKNTKISGIKSVSNLLKTYGRTQATFDGQIVNTTLRAFDENKYYVGFSADGYWQPNYITNVQIEENKITYTYSGANAGYGIGFPVKCNPNTQYTWSATYDDTDMVRISAFTADGLFIKILSGGVGNHTITTPDNCFWLVWVCRAKLKESTVNGFSNLMLNYGSTALPYRKYEESIMQLPETVELGKWDYIQDGKIVKYSKIVEFTGNETWTINENDYGLFFSTRPNGDLIGRPSSLVNNIFPSRFADSGLPCLYSPKGSLVVFPNEDKNNPKITSLEEWIAYLKELHNNGNPLTVAYPLETPTETDISANFEYLVWDKGMEQMQLENSITIPEVENEYFIILGGDE